MPEGPEVLGEGDFVRKFVGKKTLVNAEIIGGRYEKHGPPDRWNEFIDSLPLVLENVQVKGKLITFHYVDVHRPENRWWIFNTLGMSGRYHSIPAEKHSHIKLTFEDGSVLFYHDQRRFGTYSLSDRESDYVKRLAMLGKGFIGDFQITLEEFQSNIRSLSKAGRLTKYLMDQKSVCSGIGNYLLAEVLYDAKIDPFIKNGRITDKEIATLYRSCRRIVPEFYEHISPDPVESNGDEPLPFAYRKKTDRALMKVFYREEDPDGNKVKNELGPHGRTIWWVPSVQRPSKTAEKPDLGQEPGPDLTELSRESNPVGAKRKRPKSSESLIQDRRRSTRLRRKH